MKPFIRFFFFLSFIACFGNLTGCSSTKQVSHTMRDEKNIFRVPEELQDSSMIMISDSIVFSVWGEPEFSTRATVRPSGTISIPLIGEIKAAGSSRKEFELLLRKRLAEFIQGEIKLMLEINRPLSKITFLGAVGRQGSFAAMEGMELLEALSFVGGWSEQADLSNIIITRQRLPHDSLKYVIVNLISYYENGMVQELPYVYPGDFVFVPIKENFVRSISEFLQNALILFGFFGLAR